MNSFSSLRFARSISRCCASASLSRRRAAKGRASRVIVNRLTPVSPVIRKSGRVLSPCMNEIAVSTSSESVTIDVPSSA